MSHARTTDFEKPNASAEQQDSVDQAGAEKRVAEKRADDHRQQILTMAHSVVQSMVNANRKK